MATPTGLSLLGKATPGLLDHKVPLALPVPKARKDRPDLKAQLVLPVSPQEAWLCQPVPAMAIS